MTQSKPETEKEDGIIAGNAGRWSESKESRKVTRRERARARDYRRKKRRTRKGNRKAKRTTIRQQYVHRG